MGQKIAELNEIGWKYIKNGNNGTQLERVGKIWLKFWNDGGRFLICLQDYTLLYLPFSYYVYSSLTLYFIIRNFQKFPFYL